MPHKILQILRGLASTKPSLSDGEMYLEKDTSTVVVQNDSTEIRLANKTDISAVQSSISTINGNIETISNNLSTLNTEVDSKLTTPTGTKGQALGFVQDNIVGAIDIQQSSSPFNSEYNGTLPTSGWVSDSGHYYYQVTISDITADSVPLVFPQWTSNKTNEQASWNTLESSIESFNGYVRFYAPAPITTAVPYRLLYTNYDSSVITLINNIEGTQKTGTFIPA